MATIFGDIQGIKWLRESVGEPGYALVELTFTLGAYTASSDNGQLGGTGTKRNGVSVATGTTLQQILAADRRDGKTVTLGNSANNGRLAVTAEPGKQGSTLFFVGTAAVSSSNVTFNVSDAAGSEIDAASGIVDRPVVLCLGVTIT